MNTRHGGSGPAETNQSLNEHVKQASESKSKNKSKSTKAKAEEQLHKSRYSKAELKAFRLCSSDFICTEIGKALSTSSIGATDKPSVLEALGTWTAGWKRTTITSTNPLGE